MENCNGLLGLHRSLRKGVSVMMSAANRGGKWEGYQEIGILSPQRGIHVGLEKRASSAGRASDGNVVGAGNKV